MEPTIKVNADYIVHVTDDWECVSEGELVRCKNCKYWQDNNGGYPHDACKWDAGETPDPDDYCSGAERKEV